MPYFHKTTFLNTASYAIIMQIKIDEVTVQGNQIHSHYRETKITDFQVSKFV